MVIGHYTDFNFILSDFNAQLDVQKIDFNSLNNPMFNTELLNFKYNSEVPSCLGIPMLTCFIYTSRTLIISENNILKCALFDPHIRYFFGLFFLRKLY